MNVNQFFPKFNIEALLGQIDLSDFNQNLPVPLNRPNVTFTAYGRNALFLGVRSLPFKTSKNVILVPAYSCGDEIKTIINAGFLIEIYNIDPINLQVDLKSIEEKINSRVVGILITHYFGFPQVRIKEIKKICEKNRIYLIEDCAHCVASKIDNQNVGTIGDIAIFSLRKVYNILHGGALVVNDPRLNPKCPQSPSSNAVNHDMFLFLGFRNRIFKPGMTLNSILMKGQEEDPYGPRLSEYGGYTLGISNLSKLLLKLAITKRNYSPRNRNFRYYLDYFGPKKHDKIHPLFNVIRKDVNPLYFPLVVDNSEECYSKLSRLGINYIQPFWSHLHNMIDWRRYPRICKLKGSIIVIPIRNRLRKKELDQLFEAVTHS